MHVCFASLWVKVLFLHFVPSRITNQYIMHWVMHTCHGSLQDEIQEYKVQWTYQQHCRPTEGEQNYFLCSSRTKFTQSLCTCINTFL
jgi:hypothetical protein